MHVALRKAVAHAFEIKADESFRRAVDVIAATAAIARDGTDDGDRAAAIGLELFRGQRRQRDRAQAVRVDFGKHIRDGILTRRLVGQRAMGNKRRVDRPDRRLRLREQRSMAIDLRKIGARARDDLIAAFTDREILYQDAEPVRIAGDEKQARALRDPLPGAGDGDGRTGTKNDDSHEHSPTRRQKEERNFGSMKLAKASHCGKPRRNMSAGMRESLAG